MSAVPIRSDRAFAGCGYSTTWWWRATIQHASGHCPMAIRKPRPCPADTKPSALVNEKCVSALEFNTMTPSPSFVSGGKTKGKVELHRLANNLDKRTDPVSANVTILAA